MTHVLFAVLPERGHIHPFLGAAAALSAAGVRVSFYAPRDVRAILGPLGYDDVHHPVGAPPPAAEHRGEAFAALIADAPRLRAWIRAMLVDGVEGEIAPLRAHLRDARPDVVVIDPMAYFAAIAAHEEGVPWLGLSTSLNPCAHRDLESELVATLRELDTARQAVFHAHGMRPRFRVSDVLSPRGTFVLSTPSFVGDVPDDGAPVYLVGAALSAAPSTRATEHVSDQPLVYVSFGSQAYHQPARFRRVFDAARNVDAAFVVAMGELSAGTLAREAPSNVRTLAFAPQLELLSRASVLVTHGGANSIHEALALGVPLVVSPICNDQPHNGALVASSGAGRVVDLDAVSADELARVLREVNAKDAKERGAARAIRESYAAAGGAARIRDVVLREARA